MCVYYEDLFKQYQEENPDWEKFLTDSTYYELMSWFDYKAKLAVDDYYTDEARDFANYIWYTYIIPPKFKVGDSIVPKNHQEEPLTITKIENAHYYSGDLEICHIEEQDEWELAVSPVDDDLQVEIDWYLTNVYCEETYVEDIATHFAEWQKKQTIDKACKWLEESLKDTDFYEDEIELMVKELRKAMEG